MLQIQSCSISFNETPLFSELSLRLNQGEKCFITGTSGSGKTSLLRALLGFIPFSSGTVQLDGINLLPETIGSIREKTAYLPQEINYPFNTAGEVFYHPFSWKANVLQKPDRKTTTKKMNQLGLDASLLTHPYSELSGGQKQRLLLAALLLLKKPFLLLDEPFSALDSASKETMRQALLAEENTTMLIVSHDEYSSGNQIKTININNYK